MRITDTVASKSLDISRQFQSSMVDIGGALGCNNESLIKATE
jgi:hypothetical protein